MMCLLSAQLVILSPLNWHLLARQKLDERLYIFQFLYLLALIIYIIIIGQSDLLSVSRTPVIGPCAARARPAHARARPEPSHNHACAIVARNNNNNNRDNIYGVVIMAQSHCESSRSSFDECRFSASWLPTLRQTSRLGLWVCQLLAATIYIRRRHLLLLLSPKSDTHITIPQRVEGWVDLSTAGRVQQPIPKTVYRNDCRDKCTHGVLSHHSQVRHH